MYSRIIATLTLLVVAQASIAQISPPGLDDTHTAFWTAVGFTQDLAKKWSITAYVGEGRQSSPENYRPAYKQAIFVLNQETLYKISHLWATSICTSFRIQNRYAHTPPYDAGDPEFRNEARLYGRLYFRPSIGKVPLSSSFRPEYRAFSFQGETWTPVDKELRFRLKGQASFPLNKSKSNQIIIADEFLTALDHVKPLSAWTELEYTENRLSTYFRHTFKHPSMIADIGMMHQFRADGQYIAHFAVDFLFINPFGSLKPKQG